MGNNAVQTRILDSGVAVITIDLPDSKVNLLSASVMMELDQAVEQVKANPAVKGLIICSGKSDNFVAGANINEIQAIQNEPPVKAYEASKQGKELLAKIERLPYPTVAAIAGTCLGGGTELSLACKERLAADSPKTRIGVPEVQLGFIPGWGGTVRLTRLLGLQAALELVTAGNPVEARKAWKMGLVSEVVAPDKLMARAEEVALGARARRYVPSFKARATRTALEGNPLGRKVVRMMALKAIMAKTRGKFPAPLEAVKVIFAAATQQPDKAFEAESQAFARLATGQVSKNLVGIFFAQQESKKAPAGAACNLKIKKVGVLGAGVMGAGIAQAARYAGYEVVLKDIDASTINKELAPMAFVDKGMATIKGLFDSLVEKGKMTRQKADEMMAGIKGTIDYADLADCDFIIEAVVEKMKIKKLALTELQKVVKNPNFIFATNTSSLSVSEMAEGAANPSNVVGVHFFNPVYKMPLVEIVRGKQTSDATIACAKEFASRLGKTTVTAADSPGFIVNRILAPYLREAIALAEEGVPLADIDRAMKEFGTGFPSPMGPFELLDTVGLDIAGEVIRVLHNALGERMAPPAIMGKVEGLKLLGKKGGKGFYLYENGKRGDFNPDVLAAITAPRKPMGKTTIQDRLLLAMINEAARTLEEGINTDPSQIDLAMIFGTGFPPYAGGVLRLADQMGVKLTCTKLEWLSQVAGDNYRPAELLRKKAQEGSSFYAG